MSVDDENLCKEFSQKFTYMLNKYYQKTAHPSIINQTCFAIMARVMQLYPEDQRAAIIADITKLADPTSNGHGII